MYDKTIGENLKTVGIKLALDYLEANPEENIPKILNWLDKCDKEGIIKNQLNAAHKTLENKDSNWYQLAVDVYKRQVPALHQWH